MLRTWTRGQGAQQDVVRRNAEVTVSVNEHAMRYWALQFYEHVEILEPVSLRESLKAVGKTLAKKYN